jgi:hypothetical protein
VLQDPSNPMLPDLRWPEVVDALLEAEKSTAMTMLAKGPGPRIRQKHSGMRLAGKIATAL